jgi:hypothetical protein
MYGIEVVTNILLDALKGVIVADKLISPKLVEVMAVSVEDVPCTT